MQRPGEEGKERARERNIVQGCCGVFKTATTTTTPKTDGVCQVSADFNDCRRSSSSVRLALTLLLLMQPVY